MPVNYKKHLFYENNKKRNSQVNEKVKPATVGNRFGNLNKENKHNRKISLKPASNWMLLAGSVIVLVGLFGLVYDVASSIPQSKPQEPTSQAVALMQPHTSTPGLMITEVPIIPSSTETSTLVPPTQTDTPTEEINVFTALIIVENAKLRSGPSFNHPIEPSILVLGSSVTVISKEPGQLWVFIETENEEQGWLFIDWLILNFDIQTLAVAEVIPTDFPTKAPAFTSTKLPPPPHPTATIPPPPPPTPTTPPYPYP